MCLYLSAVKEGRLHVKQVTAFFARKQEEEEEDTGTHPPSIPD